MRLSQWFLDPLGSSAVLLCMLPHRHHDVSSDNNTTNGRESMYDGNQSHGAVHEDKVRSRS